MHLIINPVAGKAINGPRDILVAPHVWVGQSSLLLGGAQIGPGSIVGAHSVVTAGVLPSMSILAGQPARPIRSGVTWDRDSRVSPEAIARARAVHAAYGEPSQATESAGS